MCADQKESQRRYPKYAVFLGAGASAALASFLRRELQDDNRLQDVLPTSSKFLDIMNAAFHEQKDPHSLRVWDGLIGREPDDIEMLMRDLEALDRGFAIASAIKLDCNSCNEHKHIENACSTIRRSILETIFKHYRLPSAQCYVELVGQFYKPIFDKLPDLFGSDPDGDLTVFTTNIDLALEHLCLSKYGKNRFAGHINDGFTEAAYPEESVWRDAFDERSQRGTKNLDKLTLFKLHGSLNWYYHTQPNDVRRLPLDGPFPSPSTDFESTFLYPAYEKDIVGRRIYRDLSGRLDRYAREVDYWFFAGFSFRDNWINQVLEVAFKQSPPRKVIVVDPVLKSVPFEPGESFHIVNVGLEKLREDISPVQKVLQIAQQRSTKVRREAIAIADRISIGLKRPHLIAYWRLTRESVEIERRIALDIGERGLDGIVIGAAFRDRDMLFFDGVDDFVDVGSHESVVSSSELSVIAKARSLETQHEQVILASQGQSDVDFIFGIDSNRHLFLELTDKGTFFDLVLSESTLDTKEHYIAATAKWSIESPSLLVTFYIDGKETGRRSMWFGTTFTPMRHDIKPLPMQVTIAGSLPAIDLYKGYLSDVQLYSVALDSPRVAALTSQRP
jgi:hypothetical protein